jgi:8-oxo-dGTP pyrophosphatase MutT (NUDIX family)
MNEKVIYALRFGDRVLCEWREYDGTMQDCILGGCVETRDRVQDDYVLAAARREAKEELDIHVRQCEKLGDFVSNDDRFHIVIIETWTGTVPHINRDNHNELHWVPLDMLINSITLAPLKEVMTKLKTA